MKIINLFVCFFIFWTTTTAQVTIPPDKDKLLKGEVGEQAMVAEINGFISPQKILSLKDTIGLTKDQYNKIEEMMNNLSVSASVKGQEIVEAEVDLNNLFQTCKINDKILRTKLEAIGKLRADLRFVHLQVYIQVKQVLSMNQWEKLKEVQASEVK